MRDLVNRAVQLGQLVARLDDAKEAVRGAMRGDHLLPAAERSHLHDIAEKLEAIRQLAWSEFDALEKSARGRK